MTWSHTTSGGFSGRILPQGFIINVESPTVFDNDEKEYIMGMLNSCVSDTLFDAMNSTMHYLVGNVSRIPYMYDKSKFFLS